MLATATTKNKTKQQRKESHGTTKSVELLVDLMLLYFVILEPIDLYKIHLPVVLVPVDFSFLTKNAQPEI